MQIITSLCIHISFYTLIHFKIKTQKLNTNLNNIFYMNVKFYELLSEIDNVLPKGECTKCNLTMSA